ncbi:MAG: 50S ribosomal protein L29 [Candidatus Raymondbacteria bacterium RifOxyA12_full_50_37]|uniref:Large ribosomal subunit protein uL29 n=1 Tax=Candidatus Raymondbacteria bacterium RIFOXYD12_FULL_49_13 TaxID=1817890 RepID=A0A1F7FD64_UNCRA|nr:MAG: 50S ribosomal protein L29 [Candidatus Raymondbacteria bacterium RifOxyA12_full_50_37]OGJ94062.1 MAG: 50S ribosomal protein L29 [Candidatus Raymondbacteria bacterium RIFOXYA2_FULL_49_16]OGJ96817.1 MAG: 50S ribosomal protein L29 [Candidatus Raymondbacteria bacterium RifOxyC12_full_50_8]OGJ96887.1 MAG: 50S ribosomal protein L29 [Candidatus Raymondbacteria bacterium RIFOXYC2_FULL_50_21]OGK04614.1 MAG: 50S ribosomal protein L29 [Candidatus Raymondbacteria bacterium RIFOXYD12_FULL_49_13]OGP4
MAKAKDLRVLADTELQQKELDLREELFNVRFQQTVGQLENPVRKRLLRKDIARVKTLKRERALSANIAQAKTGA